MYQKILKFILALVLKGLKPKKMGNSIDMIIENQVIGQLGKSNQAVLIKRDDDILTIAYEINFKSGGTIDLALDYTNKELEFHFLGTRGIHHFDELTDKMSRILTGLNSRYAEISGHFEIRLIESTK